MGGYIAAVEFSARLEPSFGADRISPRVPEGAEIEVSSTAAAGIGNKWLNLVAVDSAARGGWVNLDWLKRVDSAGRDMTDAERDVFCAIVTKAARQNQTDRDYLMAVAQTESGINNTRSKLSGAFGPFQFTHKTWSDLVKRDAAETGITVSMRFDWQHQPTMAAILTRANEKSLAGTLGRPPLLGELYFAHVFGRAGASRLLSADPDADFVATYEAAFPGTSEKVAKGNPFVRAATIAGVRTELDRRLDDGFYRALPIIDRQPDEIRFVHAPAGEGPAWLRVAREELARGVAEIKGKASEKRIEEYHAAAGSSGSTDDVPWCGSFVAFCMRKSGLPAIAASLPPVPVRAANWKDWGQPAPAPTPLGAVIVLHPVPGSSSSGHVGFWVGETATHVTLLGGNQSDRVRESDYPVDRVRARRWFP